MENLIPLKKAAEFLGVCSQTLRDWEKLGKITSIRTIGGHRRYNLETLKEELKIK